MSDPLSVHPPFTENASTAGPFLQGQRRSDCAVGSQKSSVGSEEGSAIVADTLVCVAASSSNALKLGYGVVNMMLTSGNP